MARYLLDTNVLLRTVQMESESADLATGALSTLLARGDEVLVTPQVMIEFWSVATRPLDVNGLGLDCETSARRVGEFLDRFDLLSDTARVFSFWIDLVKCYECKGKQVHDARLVAVMKTHGVENVLTFNVDDFARYDGIRAVHPAMIGE